MRLEVWSPLTKSTRSHWPPRHDCTAYPGLGVADTSRAVVAVRDSTTRPPRSTYVWSRVAGEGDDDGDGEAVRDRNGVATVEESPGGGVLDRTGGPEEEGPPTPGRAGGAPKTAL